MKKFFAMIAVAMLATLTVKAQSDEPKNEIGVYYGVASASDIISTYASVLTFSSDDQTGFWGPVGIEYFYHVNPVIGIGAVASIAGCKYEYSRHTGTDVKANYYTVMPAVKFNWLRRNHFGLYSELAAGVIFMQTKINGQKPQDVEEDSATDFMWQATALGVEFGSAFRGFCELGVGEKGILCAGVRYKF